MSDCSEGLASSTPLKQKPSASPLLLVPQVVRNSGSGSDPCEVNSKSSPSISPLESSSSSFERSCSSMTVSMNRKENDSLAQNLLDDFSGRILSCADGNSLDDNRGCGEAHTDEEDYLNDDFEDEKNTETDEDKFSDDQDYDDNKDVNCETML